MGIISSRSYKTESLRSGYMKLLSQFHLVIIYFVRQIYIC